LAGSQRRASSASPERVPRRYPCRWLRRFQRAVRRPPHPRGRLLGTRQAQVLRGARRERLADRQGGARPHRPALRHRGEYQRPPARSPATRTPGAIEADRRGISRLGRRDPAQAVAQIRARRCLALHAGALDRADPLLRDGRLALDNNPAERALRCVAIGRKNYLFAGADAGGRRAAAMDSLIESAKLNGLNPQHYLADVLARIADHPARRIAELLPWNWQPLDATRAAA